MAVCEFELLECLKNNDCGSFLRLLKTVDVYPEHVVMAVSELIDKDRIKQSQKIETDLDKELAMNMRHIIDRGTVKESHLARSIYRTYLSRKKISEKQIRLIEKLAGQAKSRKLSS